MKYQIVETVYPAWTSIRNKNLTLEKAKKLCEKYDLETDVYYSYKVEKMPMTKAEIKREERKAKLEKLNETI